MADNAELPIGRIAITVIHEAVWNKIKLFKLDKTNRFTTYKYLQFICSQSDFKFLTKVEH